ncbi:unnamed protein product, partial [Ascophyllum nodosum]
MQNRVCEPIQAHCDSRQLPTGCFTRNILIQSFYTLFSNADALRLALATNSTTTPVTPESLEGVPPLSRGLYATSACECLRNVHISLFPHIFPPVQVLYYFYSRDLLLLSYKDSSFVPNHGTAATLAYVNRELTNTL